MLTMEKNDLEWAREMGPMSSRSGPGSDHGGLVVVDDDLADVDGDKSKSWRHSRRLKLADS